jgi:hypothetical protein
MSGGRPAEVRLSSSSKMSRPARVSLMTITCRNGELFISAALCLSARASRRVSSGRGARYRRSSTSCRSFRVIRTSISSGTLGGGTFMLQWVKNACMTLPKVAALTPLKFRRKHFTMVSKGTEKACSGPENHMRMHIQNTGQYPHRHRLRHPRHRATGLQCSGTMPWEWATGNNLEGCMRV